MRSEAKRILIAEDETDIAQLIELHLRDAGMNVVHRAAGDESLALAMRESFDLLILDLRLPGLSGLEVCRRLRLAGKDLPILMLTAKTSELDRVLGLELGADDYVSKPFSPLELTARVKAILRRASTVQRIGTTNSESKRLKCGEFTIDSGTRTVAKNGQKIELTAKEFELLHHFAKSPEHVFSRSDLLDQVWGYGHDGYEHTVNSHINRLRAKIEIDPASPQKILTVWGIGYKFTPE
ncbi:MAG: response regulator [Pseudomonadales bacterium]